MDVLQWCFPLSVEKGLLQSKMAPYLFDGQGEQEETRPKQRDLDSLDATQDFFGVGLEAPWRSSMSTRTGLTKHSHQDQNGITDKVDDTAFGLELKCLMPLLMPGEEDPEPDDPRQPTMALYASTDDPKATQQQAYKAIADTIRQAGHSAAAISEIAQANLQERNFWDTHWIVKRANSAEPTPSQKALKGYIWVSIEICSPKLSANEPKIYTWVKGVMDALQAKHRLVSNFTCDIHVHIGRMDDRPFRLPTLKRLAMLAWVAEPVLRTIRDPKSPNYENSYTWGAELRRFSRLAVEVNTTGGSKNGQHPPGASNGTIQDELLLNLPSTTPAANPVDIQALQMISDAPTYRSLGILLSGETKQYRRLGFNFSAFGEEDARARSNPRTVEFRIMEGTVRSDLVLAWLRVCKAVVEVAIDRDDDRLTRVLGRPLSEADEGGSGSRAGRKFAALMRDLGLSGSLYQVLLDKVVSEN